MLPHISSIGFHSGGLCCVNNLNCNCPDCCTYGCYRRDEQLCCLHEGIFNRCMCNEPNKPNPDTCCILSKSQCVIQWPKTWWLIISLLVFECESFNEILFLCFWTAARVSEFALAATTAVHSLVMTMYLVFFPCSLAALCAWTALSCARAVPLMRRSRNATTRLQAKLLLPARVFVSTNPELPLTSPSLPKPSNSMKMRKSDPERKWLRHWVYWGIEAFNTNHERVDQ